MRSRLLALAPLAAVLALAACGSDDDKSNEGAGSTETDAEGDAGLVVVGVDGLRWEDDSYSASAGDVLVRMRNESSQPHTLLIVGDDGESFGDELKATSKGDDDSGTFTLKAGDYTIICTVPGHSGMKADLTVS